MKKTKLQMDMDSKKEQELSSALLDQRFLPFISQYGRGIIYGIVAVVVLLLIVYRFSFGSAVKAEQDYFNATVDYAHLESLIGTDQDAVFQDYVARLNEILGRHPELHAKYDGPIAQSLLLEEDFQEVPKFSSLVFKRVKNDESPFYVEYSETTLLIANKNYEKALANSLELKSKMLNGNVKSSTENVEKNYGSALFALNLLRIAMLQQQLGNKQDELFAWQELQQYAKQMMAIEAIDLNPNQMLSVKAFNQLINLFAEGKISLFQYMEARKMLIQ